MTRKMSNYKTEINRLTKEVDEQRKKLDEIGGADNTTKRKPGVSTEGHIGKAALQSYGEWELREQVSTQASSVPSCGRI